MRAIAANEGRYPISAQCRLLGVARSTYYSMRSRPERPAAPDPAAPAVVAAHAASKGRYGSRKIKASLERSGVTVSRRRVCRIMRENGLVSACGRKRFKVHPGAVNEADVPNVVARGFGGRAPRTHICSDLTYVRVGASWNYVCLLVDLYNREIVGHSAGPRKDARLVKSAFATLSFPISDIEVFHTDRGSEFDNAEIDLMLEAFGIERSLSAKGCPYDNAVDESTNRILKAELVHREAFGTTRELRAKLSDYVHWYNNFRIHSTLGYMSPVEFRKARLSLPESSKYVLPIHTNSQVIFERLLGQGYAGGLTTVKTYIAAHRDLVPAKRRQAAPQGCRGQRFRTAPGEAYQMDWGFVAVERPGGERARIACFAMVCHHCGSAHVEFFPNARQENLLIGMLHAFSALGVPATVLTDNMKSVVVRRDADGRPVWQADYAEFMGAVGFRTRLCRPRHPYTKGKVERLVRFVKGNFLAGRSFTDLDALNREAALWCAEQGGRWRRPAACVPMREHEAACSANTRPLEVTAEVERYLCPRRKISFDGFVSFEGHRYGVPYWYGRRECRVNREGRVVHIYSDDLSRELVAHAVGTGADSWCEGQWETSPAQPEELPTQPVGTVVEQIAPPRAKPGFERFDFGRAE